jgi:hypothetical protein
MSLSEYASWRDFYEEEPFGDVRADLRAGVVAMTVARAVGGNKDATPIDFMPIVRRMQARADEVISLADNLAAQLAGRVTVRRLTLQEQ